MLDRKQRTVALTLATFTVSLALLLTAGCQVLRDMDRQIAHAVSEPNSTVVTTQPGVSVTPTPDPAAPYLEIAAGIAAVLGYGGLAGYIRSAKRSGAQSLKHLEGRFHDLEHYVYADKD